MSGYWRAFLHTYAQVRSKDRGKGQRWTPRPYLVVLSMVIQQALQRGGMRIALSMPSRHGKSELCSHWLPTWYIDSDPTRRVILGGYEAKFAQIWGGKVRDEFMRPGLLHKGDPRNVRHDRRAAGEWENLAGGGMVSAGVGGPVVGKGGTLLILDDPHKNWEEAHSQAKLRQLRDWWPSTFLSRADEHDFNVLVIHTRWHNQDHMGWLQDQPGADDWTFINVPALALEDDPVGREPGEPLLPDKFPVEFWRKRRVTWGGIKFDACCQGDPQPDGSRIWQRTWWKEYTSLPPEAHKGHGVWFQSWDMAFKDTASSSFVVGQVWWFSGSAMYLVDQVREQMAFLKTVQAVRHLSKAYPKALAKIIEDKANGPAVIDSLKATIPGLIPVLPYGSKVSRAIAVSGVIEGEPGVFLPAGAPWVPAFLDECTRFPHGKHDDQVDATSQALHRIMVLLERQARPILVGRL